MKTASYRRGTQKGFSPIFIIIGIVAVVLVVAYLGMSPRGFLSKPMSQNTPFISNGQISSQSDSGLKSLYSNIENTYNGNIPWSNISNRQSYQFYPKEISGLVLSGLSSTGEISIIIDTNYNPITTFSLTDSVSIPLKNAYAGYYKVPDLLREKFKLGNSDVALPVEVKVYEFDRKLNSNEQSILTKGENFRCNNDKAKTETTSFSNTQLVIYYCNVNLTQEQKDQIGKHGFFDHIYEVYFMDRNLLIQFSTDGYYINNSQDYLADYLSKILNSNSRLFIDQTQVESVDKARRFEEWRHKTFDK